MGKDLFDEVPDEEIEFKTNKDYAKEYNKFRQKELLKKLKDREGSDFDSSTSSESELSEEDVINPDFDQEFFKTLAFLKSKDPKIYDKSTKFFENIEQKKTTSQEKIIKKPFTLKDYERSVILEKDGVYEDDEDDSIDVERPQSPSYAEEQRRLKDEFKNIINNNDNSDDEEFGGIFRKREKTKAEKEKEEEQYLEWLSGKKDEIADEVKESLNPLKQYWSKHDLPKQEKFLRDYILNQGYINKEDEEIPTYDEIVGDLSEDEKELEKQDEFEHKYNFRFEEPDQEFIKRYPRTIESSVRRKDDKRKAKREEVRERKRKEKEMKMQEIEKLKALKKKEIEEKIQKLKEVTGNDQLPFEDDDLENDFDPELHDKKMKEIFNDDYYEIDEGEEKPECPDIEDLQVEDWDHFDPQIDEDDERYNYEPHCEDDDFNMDCEFNPGSKDFQNEIIESTKDKKKRRKRRNRFMEMIKQEKPPFNPEDEKSYSEYIDEYYKMNCEDIIGDLPCRFKYVETVPNDFGLTIEEILLAKNKELNRWASLKKAMQIRSEKEEKRDLKLYKLRAKNEALKRKIFVSLYGPPSDEEDDLEIKKSTKESEAKSQTETEEEKKKKKKRKRKKRNVSNESTNKKPKTDASEENVKIKEDDQSNGINHTPVNSESTSKPKNDKLKDHSAEEDRSNNSSTLTKKLQNEKSARKNLNDKFKNQLKSNQAKKGNKFKSSKTNGGVQISAERLRAYGLNPNRFYKMQKFMSSKHKNRSSNNKKTSK